MHPIDAAWSARRLVAVPLAATALLVSGLPGAAHAASTDGPDHEVPFLCGDTWTGSSRSSHSPSPLSVDWNKINDLGVPTVASAPGVVTRVANLGNRSYGRYVIVDHGGGRTTLYAHLLSVWVTQGQAVDQGTILGQVGTSGGSTGPHLHFEQRLNGNGHRSYFHRTLFRMGSTLSSRNCGDTPVVGDWDGNRTTNIGLMRRSAAPRFWLKRPSRASLAVRYGAPGDAALAGDWDGNGVTDIGVRRPGLKAFLLRQSNGSTRRITFGGVAGVGVTGDWDGNRTTEVGMWSPTSRVFRLRSATGTVTTTAALGSLGDRPVTGDWNGDRRTDLGVYSSRTATFTLRSVSRAKKVTTTRVVLGSRSSMPLAGDWNQDGIGDVGVWQPSTATFSLRVTPKVAGATAVRQTIVWGARRG